MVRCWFNLQTTTYVAFFFQALRDCSLAANKRKDHLINHVEYSIIIIICIPPAQPLLIPFYSGDETAAGDNQTLQLSFYLN